MNQADLPGDAIGYINFAAFLIGAAVINSYHLKFAVSRIYDTHQRVERQIGVRGSQRLGVETLPVRSRSPVKFRTVPTGISHPAFDRLGGIAQMSHQGSLHRWSDEEHQGYPSDCR